MYKFWWVRHQAQPSFRKVCEVQNSPCSNLYQGISLSSPANKWSAEIQSRDVPRRCNGCQYTRETQQGSPRISYLPMWSHRSEFSWDTGCFLQPIALFQSVKDPNQGQPSQLGSLEQAGGAREIAKRPFRDYGAH